MEVERRCSFIGSLATLSSTGERRLRATQVEELPDGRLAAAAEIQDLPEGGFGWYLIRTLTTDLTYLREGICNTLSFCVDVDDQP